MLYKQTVRKFIAHIHRKGRDVDLNPVLIHILKERKKEVLSMDRDSDYGSLTGR
jgi:hypothetical protein